MRTSKRQICLKWSGLPSPPSDVFANLYFELDKIIVILISSDKVVADYHITRLMLHLNFEKALSQD
jgi:hypothetical protein